MHKIEIIQNGRFPSIKINGIDISNTTNSLKLDMSVDSVPLVTIGLVTTTLLTETDGEVYFVSDDKKYRLIDITDNAS